MPIPASMLERGRSRVVTSWRDTRRTVAVAMVAAALLNATFIGTHLSSDAGGYLVAARTMGEGPHLYGSLWVDRPPGLVLAFAIADLAGTFGVQLLACLWAAVMVGAAAWAGWAVSGGAAARWSAVAAAALAASGILGTHRLNGELIAAGLVMLSCAAVLHAVARARSSGTAVGAAVLAGALGAGALLVKQNFAEALVFAAVLIWVTVRRGDLPAGRGAVLAGGVAAGALVPVSAAAVWAATHHDLAALWYAMYGFRAEALGVILAGSWEASQRRLGQMLAVAVISGLVPLALLAGVVLRRAVRAGQPVAWALAAGLFVEVVGVALGGSYWRHNLIGLIPMVALGAGLAAAQRGMAARALQVVVVAAGAITLLSSPVLAAADHRQGDDEHRVGRWLAASADPDDTAVVTYSSPNVLQESGLATPYPFAWSLPVRTLDPRLMRLHLLVVGDRPPTWLVQWDEFSAWGLDPEGRLAAAVQRRYRMVGEVCGHPVWLLDGVRRELAEPPTGCGPPEGAARR